MGHVGEGKKEGEMACPNCGKEINPSEGVKKEDGHFCCDKCCERGDKPKEEKEKSKTCEFC